MARKTLNHRILVTRTDRLGDTLLALPALDYLRKYLPSEKIDFLCQRKNLEAIEPFLRSREIQGLVFNIFHEPGSQKPIDLEHYDALLFLFAPDRLFFESWKKRVPIRIGPCSRLASFLFLNDGIAQHRSKALRHESDYNMELAQLLVSKFSSPAPLPSNTPLEIDVDEKCRQEAHKQLQNLQIRLDERFIMLHPGMGGSALNLSETDYVKIIQTLSSKTRTPIILSAGPSPNDQALKRFILTEIPQQKVLEGVKLPVLREVFRSSSLVIAPSTGPLHLAHFSATPTIALFPPLLSQHPRRWAPRGGNAPSVAIFPEVECLEKKRCNIKKCSHFNCMSQLKWDELILAEGHALIPFS